MYACFVYAVVTTTILLRFSSTRFFLGQYKLEDVAFPDDVVAFFDVKELRMKNKIVDEQNCTALVDGCAVVESYSNDSRIEVESSL